MSVRIFGNRIAFYRKVKGYTQSDLARLLGVSKNTISSYECCDFYPSLEHALDLCILLDVYIYDLFDVAYYRVPNSKCNSISEYSFK